MSWRYNPFSGTVDFYPEIDDTPEESLSAKRLEIDKIASGNISTLQLVSLITDDTVTPSGVATRDAATVFGMAITDAGDGELVRILLFGHYTNENISFGLNQSLFQDALGNLTTTATTIVGESWARVGRSYGGGSVFISPEAPVEVQA